MVIALEQAVVPATGPAVISGQAIAAVVICIGLLLGLSVLLRRGLLMRRTSLPVTVETAVPLGERRSLVIVAVEGRRLLLGLTPGSVSLVTELQPPFAQVLDDEVARDGAA
jgi:flagellar protein FliO/FliZ